MTQELRYDIVVVGAGPAGLTAGLGALQNKLRYLILEQDTLGGTVAHFPRKKMVMTALGSHIRIWFRSP